MWGGIPALPVAHLCGRLCAACALSVPMPDRAGKPGFFFFGGGGGYLMGINHGREWRAGGRKTEGEGGRGSAG